jgi:dihydromonapterin reductase/dihydrofolate reductase
MKTILITGVSRRLGLFLTESFLLDDEDTKVIALTRKTNETLRKLEKIGNLQIIETDYSSIDSLSHAITEIMSQNKTIDLIVHNASRFEKDELHADDIWSYYDSLYEVHMKMPAYLNENLFELLKNKDKPGCIIHITDISVENPYPEFTLYCSTKAGLENMTKSYAKKFSPYVRVNSILPGPIRFLPSHTPAEKEKISNQTLLNVEPGFLPILKGIQFIFDNQFITGSSIKIDGGRSITKL